MNEYTNRQVQSVIRTTLLGSFSGFTGPELAYRVRTTMGNTVGDVAIYAALDDLIEESHEVIIRYDDSAPVYLANRSTFDGPDSWGCAN